MEPTSCCEPTVLPTNYTQYAECALFLCAKSILLALKKVQWSWEFIFLSTAAEKHFQKKLQTWLGSPLSEQHCTTHLWSPPQPACHRSVSRSCWGDRRPPCAARLPSGPGSDTAAVHCTHNPLCQATSEKQRTNNETLPRGLEMPILGCFTLNFTYIIFIISSNFPRRLDWTPQSAQ